MRRFLALSLSVLLMAHVLVVPAYAAAPYDADWVPPVPEFITPVANGFQMVNPLGNSLGDQKYQEPTDWIEGLLGDKNAVFLFLLDQGVYNRYKEENGIDYDRQFSVYIVAPDKKANGSYHDLGGFEHTGGPGHVEQMVKPSPMTYLCLNNPHSFVKSVYDPKTKQFSLQPSLSRLPAGASIRFTYVLAAGNVESFSIGSGGVWSFLNGPTAEPIEIYPYFSQVCGKDFGVDTIYHQVVDGETVYHYRCYDWWLGIEGEEIPPWPPDTGDGPGSGGGSSGGSSGSGGDGGSSSGGSSGSGGEGGSSSGGSSGSGGDGGSSSGGSSGSGGGGGSSSGGSSGSGGDGGSSSGGSSGSGGDGGSSSGGSSDSGGDGGSSSGDSSGSGGEGPGSGGGSSGGGDGPGSDGGNSSDKGSTPPDTWFDDPEELPRDPWEFFDPFKFDYDPFVWDRDYDPLEGYDPGRMPDFPKPGNPNSVKDPFDIPHSIKFRDFLIKFWGLS